MELLNLRITGMSALLMNNPADMAAPKIGLKVKKFPPPEEEAETKAYRLPDGQLFIRSEGFRIGIIKKACTGRKIGKRFASSVIPGALFLLEEECPLHDLASNDNPLSEYEIDIRRVVIQKKDGVMRARPKMKSWGCIVHYEFEEDFLNPDIILDLQNIAGKLAGVGDYRPEKGGPFGRYYAEILD